MVGADGDPGVHEEAQHHAERHGQSEAGNTPVADQLIDTLRDEHDVKCGNRCGEQQ